MRSETPVHWSKYTTYNFLNIDYLQERNSGRNIVRIERWIHERSPWKTDRLCLHGKVINSMRHTTFTRTQKLLIWVLNTALQPFSVQFFCIKGQGKLDESWKICRKRHVQIRFTLVYISLHIQGPNKVLIYSNLGLTLNAKVTRWYLKKKIS